MNGKDSFLENERKNIEKAVIMIEHLMEKTDLFKIRGLRTWHSFAKHIYRYRRYHTLPIAKYGRQIAKG